MELSEIKEQEKKRKMQDRKIEPIDSGQIVNRRRSFFRKFLDEVKPEEDQSIFSYVVFKILIPSALNTLHDSLNAAVDIFFTGSVNNKSSSGSVRTLDDGYKDYGRIYGKKSSTSLSTTSVRRMKDYRDYLTFRTNETARRVWDHLQGCIDEDGCANLEDLLMYLNLSEMVDWNSASNGWTSLKGAFIRHLPGDRWELVLPRLEKL